jgi:importin-9
MVIGYNPSHSNINSEVNAPFKMLSLLLRFLENESKPNKLRAPRKPVEDYDDDVKQEVKKPAQRSAFGSYEMKRTEEKEKREKKERDDL